LLNTNVESEKYVKEMEKQLEQAKLVIEKQGIDAEHARELRHLTQQ